MVFTIMIFGMPDAHQMPDGRHRVSPRCHFVADTHGRAGELIGT